MNSVLQNKRISKRVRLSLGRINVREITVVEMKTTISSLEVRHSDLHRILKTEPLIWQRWLLAYHLPDVYYIGSHSGKGYGSCHVKNRTLPDLDLIRDLHNVSESDLI